MDILRLGGQRLRSSPYGRTEQVIPRGCGGLGPHILRDGHFGSGNRFGIEGKVTRRTQTAKPHAQHLHLFGGVGILGADLDLREDVLEVQRDARTFVGGLIARVVSHDQIRLR